MKFPFVKFPTAKAYLPSRLHPRAPKLPIILAAGIPRKEVASAVPDETAPTVPQAQLAAKHALATKLLAVQKFIPDLPVVVRLSTKRAEFANVGNWLTTLCMEPARLLIGVGAKSTILSTLNKNI